MEHRPDAVAQGQQPPRPEWSRKSRFQGTGDFYDLYRGIRRLINMKTSTREYTVGPSAAL